MRLVSSTNFIGVTLAFICTVYFNYLPFQFLISVLPNSVSKTDAFLILLGAANLSLIVHFLLYRRRLSLKLLKVILLYLIFAIYATISYILHYRFSDDIFNIRTIAVINPIFIIMALSSIQDKTFIVKLLYLSSSVYFIFGILSLIKGDLSFSSLMFQSVINIDAIGLEKVPYQNTNTYLGIFVILNIFYPERKDISKIVRWGMLLLSGIAIFLMLLIGGRASIVALCSVLVFFAFFKHINSFSKRTIKTLVFFILALFLVLFIQDKITDFLRDTISIKRFSILLYEGDRSHRIFFFSKAIELFFLNAKNTFFGAGINAYSVFIQKYISAAYPHNIILELLAEYGIIGTTLFFLPIFYILLVRNRELSTLYGNSYHEQTIFVIVVYFWIIHMFTGGLRTSWLLVFFTCLLIPSEAKNTAEYLRSIGRPKQHVPRQHVSSTAWHKKVSL